MKQFRSASLWAATAVVTVACATPGERGGPAAVVERDSAGVRIVELGDVYSDSLPRWRLKEQPYLTVGDRTESPGHELFGAIGATLLPDGGVAVANANSAEIRIFDRTGQHVRSFGRRGEGPGDFAALAWLGLVGDDTLAAFDVGLRRVTWFTLHGEVLGTLPLEQAGAGGFPDPVGMMQERMVVRSGSDRQFGQGERRDTIQLFRYDAAGKVTDTLGRYPGPELFFYTDPGGEVSQRFEPIFARDAEARLFAGRLVVASSDRFELDVHDGLGLSLKVRAAVARPPVTAAEVESWREKLRERYSSGMFAALIAGGINDVPARGTTPAFQRLAVDSEGAIWVEEPHRVPTASRQWLILGADGIPKGRIEIPAELDIYEIGPRYILGRERDEQGVERIAVYALERRP